MKVMHAASALTSSAGARMSGSASRPERSPASSRPAAEAGDERHAIVIPGMPNLHSHAFQRGMAGLAESRGAVGRQFLELARGDVPLRAVDDAGAGGGGGGAALCRDAGGRLHPRRRVPLSAPRPGRPPLCQYRAR